MRLLLLLLLPHPSACRRDCPCIMCSPAGKAVPEKPGTPCWLSHTSTSCSTAWQQCPAHLDARHPAPADSSSTQTAVPQSVAKAFCSAVAAAGLVRSYTLSRQLAPAIAMRTSCVPACLRLEAAETVAALS
jgi:hypothetical protein